MSSPVRDGSHHPVMFNSASNFSTQGTYNAAGRDIVINPTQVVTGKDVIEDFRTIANWLTPINFKSIQSDTFSVHAPGTGSWFLGRDEFKHWVSTSESDNLWVTGIPGAGKTILSSIAIDHLQSIRTPEVAIVFAFCRYNDKYSLNDILSSFLKQLFENHEHLRGDVDAFYARHRRDDTKPSQQQLVEILHRSMSTFKKVFISIDAIDEIPDKTKEGLLKALATFRKHVLLTSRPLDSFKHILPNTKCMTMDASSLDDIEQFLRFKIKESTRLNSILKGDETLIEELCNRLKVRSQGMFLVAALHFEALQRVTTLKRLRQAVESLPSGIWAMYESTFARIKAQSYEDAALATKTILWLTHATRTLTITELLHALAISNDTYDGDDVIDENLLVGICCGLLAVDQTSQAVRLVHFTAREFFEKLTSDGFATPHSFITTSCFTYLTTIRFHELPIHTYEELHTFLELRNNYLADYAYHEWTIHAAYACGREDYPAAFILTFLQSMVLYPSLYPDAHFDLLDPSHMAIITGIPSLVPYVLERRDHRSKLLRLSSLHICSLYGQTEMCRQLLHSNMDPNITDAVGYTPLILASQLDHWEIVELMLSSARVDVNKQDSAGNTALLVVAGEGNAKSIAAFLGHSRVSLMSTNALGHTMLHKAVLSGNQEAVSPIITLAGEKIDVNALNYSGDTPLALACREGFTTISEYLMSQDGVDVDLARSPGTSPLHQACKYGRHDIVNRLLSHKDVRPSINQWHPICDINDEFDSSGNRALHLAVTANYENIVGHLLSSCGSLDPNVQNASGDTPLVLACALRRQNFVELLLSHPAIDVNCASSVDFRTALHIAIIYGCIEAVVLLLSRPDINVHLRDANCDTALHLAANSELTDALEFLIALSDIDINEKGMHGNTALHQAILANHEDTVSLLLNHPDIDPNAENDYGDTPLVLAMSESNDNDSIIQLLLLNNAIDVNKVVEGGTTVLHEAVATARVQILEYLLLRPELDVNVQDGDGNTALICACEATRADLVQLLLTRADIDVNRKNNGGETALTRASMAEDSEAIIQLLLALWQPW